MPQARPGNLYVVDVLLRHEMLAIATCLLQVIHV